MKVKSFVATLILAALLATAGCGSSNQSAPPASGGSGNPAPGAASGKTVRAPSESSCQSLVDFLDWANSCQGK
jgi:hypothetical protein